MEARRVCSVLASDIAQQIQVPQPTMSSHSWNPRPLDCDDAAGLSISCAYWRVGTNYSLDASFPEILCSIPCLGCSPRGRAGGEYSTCRPSVRRHCCMFEDPR